MREVVFRFKVIGSIFTKSLKQYLYRGEPTKQLPLIYLSFIIDILEANYNVLLKQIYKYFTRRNTTSQHISNHLVYFLSMLAVIQQSYSMRKGFVIISQFLYFYLPPNYYIYKGKFKRAVSYIRASKALPSSPFIAITFSIPEPHFTHSRW